MHRNFGSCRGLLLLLLLLQLSGCAGIRPQPPEVSLSHLQVGEITLSHANLLAKLRIYNPNRIALTLEEVDYTLTLNGIRISTGRSIQPTTVAAQGHGNLTIQLNAAYLDIFRLVQASKDEKTLKYSLQGNIQVSGLGVMKVNFPLREMGEIQIEK